jgi:hypothetical protein
LEAQEVVMNARVFLRIVALCFTFQAAIAQFTWQKHPDNPVLRFRTEGVDDPSGYKYALDPTLLVDQNGLYHMWFTSLAYGYGTSFCMSEAISTDRVRWFTYFKNPVFGYGPPGTFDERGIRPQSVIKDSTGYKMYFVGFTNEGDHAVGLATSADGITWIRHPANPILDGGPPGTWDSLKISSASVYFDGSSYTLWYTGENGGRPGIGLATSPDGISWTKYPGNPILVPGPPGDWDDESVEKAKVINVENMFYMFYAGNAISPVVNAFHIGCAFSADGIHWTKYGGNPVLQIGNAPDWDGMSLQTTGVIYEDGRFHLWYSGLGLTSSYWQTGYATSDYTPLSVHPQSGLPTDILLSQCFPNPFNPRTTISYQLPKESHVTLGVFDVLGQAVATLVDAMQEPGYKSVTFDASNLASGEYLYRLSAGGLTVIRKMSLVK